MELKLIRNATLRLRYGGIDWLIDPMLGTRNSIRSLGESAQRNPIVELPCPVTEVLAGVDVVVVSHNHPDHFDAAAEGLVPRHLPVFCCPPDAAALTGMGFESVHGLTQPTIWNGVQLVPTAGSHGTGALAEKMGEVIGLVFRAEHEPTLYWAGDTVLTTDVLDTIEREQPDVIVTHSGGAAIGGGHIIMGADDTIAIAQAAPNATVVAVHFEAIALCPLSRSDMRTAADQASIDPLRLVIPHDGETLTFDCTDD